MAFLKYVQIQGNEFALSIPQQVFVFLCKDLKKIDDFDFLQIN